MAGSAISFVQVEHWFDSGGDRPVRVLERTNLHVPSGQFVALIGPSGCGKTTLLNMVSGLIEPRAGEVMVNGAKPQVGAPQCRLPVRARCAGSLAHRGRQRLAGARIPQRAAGAAPPHDRPRARRGGARRVRRFLPLAAVARHAPAGRARPHAGARTRHAADGRAVLRRSTRRRASCCRSSLSSCGRRAGAPSSW